MTAIEPLIRRLHATTPLVGARRRSAALRALLADGGPAAVDALADAAFRHADPAMRQRCLESLLGLARAANAAAREAVARLALHHDLTDALEAARAGDWAPADLRQRAAYYFLTGQWGRYEDLDFDHALLRGAWDLAGASLRSRLTAAAQTSGRMEWLVAAAGGGPRHRAASGLSAAEADAIFAWLAGQRRWADLHRLASALPPLTAAGAYARLGTSGWAPPGAEDEVKTLAVLAHAALDAPRDPPSPFTRAMSFPVWHKGDLFVLPQPSSRHGFGFSRDGSSLVAPAPQPDRVAVRHLPSGHWREYLCARSAVSPDGASLATVDEARVSIRNIPTDYVFDVWRLPASPLWLGYSADGAWLMALTRTRFLARRMDPAGRAYVEEAALPPADAAAPESGAALLADGRALALATPRGGVRVWRLPDLTPGPECPAVAGAAPEIPAFAARPDGGALLVAQPAPVGLALRLLRPGASDALSTWDWPEAGPRFSGAFSRDGQWLAARTWAEAEVRAALFDAATGQIVQTFAAPVVRESDHRWLLRAALSGDGRCLAVRTQDAQQARAEDLHRGGEIEIWEQDGDRSRLKTLLRSQARRAGWADLEWLQRQPPGAWRPGERAWAAYAEALLRARHAHDIEIADAPARVMAGEFDIELDA